MSAVLAPAARLRRTAAILGVLALVAVAATGIFWSRPDPVAANPLTGVTAVSAGEAHTCALTTGGGVKCWGDNVYRQLGDGTTTSSPIPVDVSGLTSGVAAVSAGGEHTCALTTAGGVKCWGANYAGQLGDGTTTTRSAPADVSGLTSGVAVVTAGGSHTCALTTAGGAKCWGYNNYGELGDGTTTNSATPVDVSGLSSGVAAVVAGDLHTCAVTTAGGVKCWGYNHFGQLGAATSEICTHWSFGDVYCSTTPVDVVDLAGGVAAITAGIDETCALTTSGGAKCWGWNGYGQLGDGTTTSRTTPVDVSGLTSGVAAITAGGYHTCALTASGGAKCWGQNSFGALGDGTTTTRATPVGVLGLASGVGAVAAGGSPHTCALTASGGVKCWGGDGDGQLGDGVVGLPVMRTTPVDVVEVGPKPTPTATPCSPEGCPTATATPAPPTGPLDFSIGVDADGDTTDDCATKDGEPAKCSLSLGSSFVVRVYLNGLPGGVAGYRNFDISLTYAGLSSQDNANALPWPDCAWPVAAFGPGEVLFGCVLGFGADPSTYTGLIGTNDFDCTGTESAGNTVMLVHGAASGDTALYDEDGISHDEGQGTTETLVINCLAPTPTPPPAPTPTPVGGSGFFAETADSSGSSAGTVTVLIAASTAGALALGGAAWYARRRRRVR